jgi:glycerol-3-phosphate acyltransferase PlsY
MYPWLALAVAVPSYLTGAVPFGYLIARARGVNIFEHGSGNIGATNVGRVLGRTWGLLCFVLDFLKGALPALLAARLAGPELPAVLAGLAAFLGHLFPVYLGFRGGKGVATGAGVVVVLLPVPFAVSLLIWSAAVPATRTVSLASVTAAVALAVAQLVAGGAGILTGFALVAAALVVLRHVGNLRRVLQGTESRLPDTPAMLTFSRTLHVLALALWLGSGVFFNLIAAPIIFESFEKAVRAEPGPRTANVNIAADVDKSNDERVKQLSNALAGTAVGPLFKPYFALQAVCAAVALVTALGWAFTRRRGIDVIRAVLIGLAAVGVAVGWPLAVYVGELRELRYGADSAAAAAAKAAFGPWHAVSLILSLVTLLVVFLATLTAGRLPEGERPPSARGETVGEGTRGSA